MCRLGAKTTQSAQAIFRPKQCETWGCQHMRLPGTRIWANIFRAAHYGSHFTLSQSHWTRALWVSLALCGSVLYGPFWAYSCPPDWWCYASHQSKFSEYAFLRPSLVVTILRSYFSILWEWKIPLRELSGVQPHGALSWLSQWASQVFKTKGPGLVNRK